jgi:D-glycero-alpha-D-manno-heptose-7-phosphate kinase
MRVHAKSPLRLGLAGGGTDVAPYSDIYGGQVLNATISLFTHCDISYAADGQVHFLSSDFDIEVNAPADAQLPLEGPLVLHKAVYRSIISKFNNGRPLALRVVTYSDAPPGSGVGSSSSLVVCMIEAYRELLNLPLGEYDVAHLAYEIERIDCAMAGGKQDQYAAAFGGFNFMEFSAGDKVIVNPLRLKTAVASDLESRLLLYYTGQSRESAKIIESQIIATQSPSSPAMAAMHDIRQAATDMKEALLKGKISQVLDILGSSWHAKKRAAENISNSYIDSVASIAQTAGAAGLKISGAGGGGFMMIAVDPEYRWQVIRALNKFEGRFFTFTFTESGAQSWKSQ